MFLGYKNTAHQRNEVFVFNRKVNFGQACFHPFQNPTGTDMVSMDDFVLIFSVLHLVFKNKNYSIISFLVKFDSKV